MKIQLNLIIKIVMTAFLFVYLGALYLSDYTKDISMTAVESYMTSHTSITTMKKRERRDLSRYFSIEEENTDGYLYYKDISPMSVNEILIVRAKGRSQASDFLKAAEDHKASQENVFGSYGTDQMALLGEAYVESKGNYVCYICGPDASAWHDAFFSLI